MSLLIWIFSLALLSPAHAHASLPLNKQVGGVLCFEGIPSLEPLYRMRPFTLKHFMLAEANDSPGYAEKVKSGEAERFSARFFFWYNTREDAVFDSLTFKLQLHADRRDPRVRDISAIKLGNISSKQVRYDEDISYARNSSCFWLDTDDIY